jgi:hypothetical protein
VVIAPFLVCAVTYASAAIPRGLVSAEPNDPAIAAPTSTPIAAPESLATVVDSLAPKYESA